MALALSGYVSGAMAEDRRDLVFDCPCSAEWVADEPGGPGSLVLQAGIVSHRATKSGEVWLSARPVKGSYPVYDGTFAGSLAARHRELDEWVLPFGAPDPDAVIEVLLQERTGPPGSGEGNLEWDRHDALALWPAPGGGAGSMRFVDILTDADGDGVGDVNERLAGTSPEDPESTPSDSVIDVLPLYTAEFREAEAGYPYARLLHHMSVAAALFEDSGTGIRLRTIGMSEVAPGDLGWARSEDRRELVDAHGADVTVQFGPSSNNGGPCNAAGCARVGAHGSSHWSDADAWVNLRASALTTAHELGHVMGLAHSARQGETYGAWRWSRGHYVSPRGTSRRLGTIMAYGFEVLGGVFSNPAADCGIGPCGVPAGELDGADSVATLDLLRFQIAAHRAPATDTDGDGFVDAADSFPDDPGEWFDVDGDGIGDNADADDDNDGTPDVDDPFPLDPDEWADADGDGIGDNADGDVQDLSPFRDPGLRAAVEAALGKEAGAPITAEDMAGLTQLSAWGRRIRDLTGLELATELTELSLGSNRIHDLSPLSELTALWQLNLIGSSVSDLSPLSKLLALWQLNLDGNPVSDLGPLSGLSALRQLYLSDTHVEFAEVRALPYFHQLTGLGLGGLSIQDLSPLSGITALRSLGLDGNAISDIGPLRGLANLRYLYLDNNRVSDISPLSEMTTLRRLHLDGNAVSDIGPLRGLANLDYLYLDDNRVSDVSPLSEMTTLRRLGLDGNAVSDIGPLRGLANLEYLYLDDNRVSDVSPLSEMTALKSLDLAGNAVSDIGPLRGLANLDYLYLDDNRVSDVSPLSDMTALKFLDLAGNAVSNIGPLVDRSIFGGAASTGAFVNLDLNPLDDQSVEEHIPALRSWGVKVFFETRGSGAIAIADPTLRALVSEAVASASVHVDDPATSWPIHVLRQLRIHGRDVATLAGLEAATGLEALQAASNRIADLSPLAELPNLRVLDLRRNRVSDLSPLVANGELDAGDRVALEGNPLSEESLNTHIPALMERGVVVSVGPILLSLAAGDAPTRFDVSDYFEVLLGAGVRITAASEDESLAAAEADGGVLVVEPGGRSGAALVTVEAADGQGAVETLTFAVRVRGPWLAPFFPNASGPRQGFLRVVNHSPRAGVADIAAIDDAGAYALPVTLAIGAGESAHFNSGDLEFGNPDKGLAGAAGSGAGDWRLAIGSDLELEVLSYIRTPDGFVTAMHDVVPKTADGHRVAIFNPASNLDQASLLRVTNLSGEDAQVAISGIDARGESPGGEVRAEVAAGASLTLSAEDLEAGGPGLRGRLGDGAGKWRLLVGSDQDLSVMSLLRSPGGHLSNLSAGAAAALGADGVHRAPLFPSAADPQREGFVRIVNRSGEDGVVRIQPYDDAGRRYETLSLSLGADRTAHFNSNDLELGNPSKGLAGSSGPGDGDWRLELSTDLDIEVLAYVRAAGGFLTSMHGVARQRGRRHEVAFFNPGGNDRQSSRLRIVNPNASPAHVSVAGVDARGKPGADVVRMTIPPRASVLVTAAQLEEAAGAASVVRAQGVLGDGAGKWRLTVDSEQPILVMSLLASPTGHLTNLSTSPNW